MSKKNWVKTIVLVLVTVSLSAEAATRNYQLALFGNKDTSCADLTWLNPGEPQPAAPVRSILQIDGIYWNPAAFAALSYDWSRIAAVVIDEPYWNASGGPSTADCSTSQ